jgi:HEAT repeat protein
MELSRAMVVLLAAALPAACSGGEEKKPAPNAAQGKPAGSKPAAKGESGLDLSSLQASTPVQKPEAPPPGGKPADPTPSDGAKAGPPAPAAPGEEAKPGKPAEAKAPDGKAADGKGADGKPAVPPPTNPDEITDTEVLMAWSKEEREALNEMSEADKAKEIQKRRLEMFKERGGVLDKTSGKMADKKVDAATGERGPARPDAVKEKELPPPELRDILQDIASSDPEIRARGVEAAKRFSDKGVAAHHILPLLQDRDPEIRSLACSTLGALKQADSVDALARIIEKGDKDQVRSQAIRALGDIAGFQGRAALRAIARAGTEPQDRSEALGALIRLREVGEVKDLLKAALDDLDGGVRQQAVIAIREFNIKTYEEDLFPRLKDASEQVIMETIRTLGSFGTRSAVAPLMKILLSPDPDAEDSEILQDAANTSLELITGVKQGYTSTSVPAKAAALDNWRIWWKKNKDTWK